MKCWCIYLYSLQTLSDSDSVGQTESDSEAQLRPASEHGAPRLINMLSAGALTPAACWLVGSSISHSAKLEARRRCHVVAS